jgi:cyclophilin family peptidyl-prolyl cis-trans isomerase/HEAT repeat protein
MVRRSWWVLASRLLPLLVAGCTGAPPGRPAARPGAVLELEVRAMLLLLADRQIYEPVTVREALKGDAALRAELALVLGRARDPEGEHVLAELLRDDAPEVRRAAAFALGVLADARARPALLLAVADADHETGVRAVAALGRSGASVLETAEQLLTLPEAERWARLVPSLFRFREEAMLPLAEHALSLADRDLHAWAAYGLSRDPLPAAAPLLRPLLADADPRVRAWAARGLGRLGARHDLPLLAPLLGDPTPAVIIQALDAGRRLAALPGQDAPAAEPPASWRPALVRLLTDPRPQVRLAALDAAGSWLPDPALSAALVRRAEEGEAWERGPALVALAAGHDRRALELVAKAAASSAVELRAKAAEAAVLLKADDLLVHLVVDPSPPVRVAAYGALLPSHLVAGSAEEREAMAIALRGLGDASEGVRATVLGWLPEHPVLPLAELEPALVRALADPSVESGSDAIGALTARATVAPLERGAIVTLLEKATASGSYVTRREAGVALGKLERPVPPRPEPEPRREIRYYREVLLRTRASRLVEVRTVRGSFTLRLACPEAPLTCLNFLTLAAQGAYDGLPFHRVVPDFVVQGGDPDRDGFGGPGYTIRDEPTLRSFDHRGVVGMALAGADTAGSQFFVTLAPAPHLDPTFTAFGEVIAGSEVLDLLVPGDLITTVREVAAPG